ncbi:hypothetical protein BAUCODRAFT_558740 [Baudoinia panamericana UAMH 10762]|uniref:Uncharacterized protein n=1 Tax=Baudoinia panamericana (strain UAMH 10762) TaxID=717646 RepID=M2MDV2_BAUPA|nr:uncharacterized protein BAUCODRAFT_558740 [Baudoinia panamericana UAMH 10762]EMC94741.1 hypothetical protein BAUCODRAFT_558740 [Baudoinia panamericana UAMH 10762]
MSPIRRYLRITKYSVLEVRIYLEKPSDASWLLSSREPVLHRIIEAVRPLVLPKLREENENAKKKSSKKQRGIKDVVVQDDFEVTIFLTELSTRHSLLTKQKHFSDKPKLKSTSNRLTGWLKNDSANPIHVEEDEEAPEVLREDGDDVPELRDIPEVGEVGKRKGGDAEDEEPLFVSSDDEEFFATQRERRSKRRKRNEASGDAEPEEPAAQDDKKKLALDTSYDGFSIYGRMICLLVKRKGKKAQVGGAPVGGSQMMEEWVSTQAAQEAGLNDDD